MRSELKVKISDGPLDNQTWQTEWKTILLAKVQLCEYENETLKSFAAASCLYAKFDNIETPLVALNISQLSK